MFIDVWVFGVLGKHEAKVIQRALHQQVQLPKTLPRHDNSGINPNDWC